MYKNLLLLVFSTLVSLGILEVSLRLIMPERLAFVPTLLNNDTTYVPNQIERSRHLEWDHEVRINADGFRNDRTLSEIPDGTTLILGDSFTEGKGVALNDSYPKQLEILYRSVDSTIHVYNAGHYDTGLPTYRRVYETIFRDVAAINNVFIGLFVGNDVLRTAHPPDGRLQLGNEFGDGWKYKLKVFLGSNVATYAVLNYVVKTNPILFRLCKSLGACYRPRPPNIYAESVIQSAVPHTLDFTTKLVRDIHADGRRVIVLLIPTREQVDDEIWAEAVMEYGEDAEAHRFTMNQRLHRGLRDAGIEVIDFTEIAVKHQRTTGERLYFKYDGHWNPAGHALAARRIFSFIQGQSRSAVTTGE